MSCTTGHHDLIRVSDGTMDRSFLRKAEETEIHYSV